MTSRRFQLVKIGKPTMHKCMAELMFDKINRVKATPRTGTLELAFVAEEFTMVVRHDFSYKTFLFLY